MSDKNTTENIVKKPTVKYTLLYPVKWGEEVITEIEFSRPKGKHIKRIGSKADLETLIGVAVKVSDSEYTPKFFDELDGADYVNITEVIGDFLDNGPETGAIT